MLVYRIIEAQLILYNAPDLALVRSDSAQTFVIVAATNRRMQNIKDGEGHFQQAEGTRMILDRLDSRFAIEMCECLRSNARPTSAELQKNASTDHDM